MKCSKIISAVLAAIMTIGMATVASANELSSALDTEIVMPAYEIANNPVSQLSISGTTATCTSKTNGTSVKSITAEQTLEKYWGLWIWNEVDGANWSKTVKANNLYMTNNKSGLDSGTYRLKTVFTLTANDGTTETITVYSQEKII